jgi:hypothetical protein
MAAAGVVSGQIGYARRRIPWRQIAGAVVLCAPLMLAGSGKADSANEVLPLIRIAALTLATTAVFALHDPSAPVTHASPPGRLHLRCLAATLTFVVIASVWAALVVLSDSFTESSLRPLMPGASVELMAMYTGGLAVGAVTERATSVRLAPAWGAATLVMMFAASLTDARLRAWLWVEPGPDWQRAHARWATLAVTGFVAFAWSSRDPARRALRSGMNRPSRPARQDDDVSV